jgi:hypothetical protein
VSCVINFANGLVDEEDDEVEESKKSEKILTKYSKPLFMSMINLLKKAMT